MVGRQEGSFFRDLLQQHVPATKRCVVHTEETCIRVVLRGHVAGTKSQHLHTRENVAGTCFRDILQRYVAETSPI